MAMLNHTAADLGIIARLRGIIDAIAEARGRRRVYNETLRELGNLSQRELNDLGIGHGMINRIAHEAAYGK